MGGGDWGGRQTLTIARLNFAVIPAVKTARDLHCHATMATHFRGQVKVWEE